MKYFLAGTLMIALLHLVGCGGESKEDKVGKSEAMASRKPAPIEKTDTEKQPVARALLMTQSTFAANAEGKYVMPEAGQLLILTPGEDRWKVETISDKESNVFHKAIQYGDKGILTIGGNEARLKLWNRSKGGEWTAEVLWAPTFGGKQNRLRDFEMADFNGDGAQDLAIATHDQGVVAVVWNRNGKWEVQEIDRRENTFVHEIEIGDLDGDGKMEIYATPSDPNTSSGHKQGGAIVRYSFTGDKFEKSDVVRYDTRHIKEILVADVDGDGKKELYAALEAQMGENLAIEVPVEIMRFDYKNGAFVGSKIAQINDRFCRFLTAGDLDGDGVVELVASAFSSGIHLIQKSADGWSVKSIDKNTGGFEHATWIADIDGDGKLELYVADDNSGTLRQYKWNGSAFRSTDIYKRLVAKQAMVWNFSTASF